MLLDPKIPAKIARLETVYDPLRYAPVGTVEFQMAETREHYREVPPEGALAYRPANEGDGWGDDFVSAWFRGTLTVPEGTSGKVFLRAQTGGTEAMLLVDGVHRGVFDWAHPVRLVSLTAKPGDRYAIDLEAYAGHTFPGTQPYEGIRTSDGAVWVTPGCRKVGVSEILVEREDVTAFVHELKVLRQIAANLPAESLRRGKILAGFEGVFRAVFAKPEETDEMVWRAAIAEARAIMQPLLETRNGPSTPFMGVFGHSHIDTAWLWPLGETWRKLARTYSSALALMDQYPEFTFMQSAACHYDVVRRLYPAIYERVRQRVAEGRWEVNGAMWIEPDCNIPSGESFVRQCLVGQRATREMFGVTSDTLWQPDVFGYSAALPQILRKSGVRFFCTTKLSWNDTNRFPYDTFWWQGIDGTSVLSHFNEMQGLPDPERMISLWQNVQHNDVQDRRMVGFGHGDGGGGPMPEMIETVRLIEDVEGCPRTGYTTISRFMTEMEQELPNLPRWVGELYLELHRGTLTSIAAIKRLNRRCEYALRDAELVATMAKLGGGEYPRAELLDAWKKVLLNQFHDILPGSSIAEVNDEAIALFHDCLTQVAGLRDAALAAQNAKGDGVTLTNTLSWDRHRFDLTLPEGKTLEGATSQRYTNLDGEARTAVSGATVPGMAQTAFALAPVTEGPSAFVVGDRTVETPFANVRFDDAGRIVSFWDKRRERELVRAGGVFNGFLMGEDVPAAWDNWDIDRDQRHKMAPVTDLVDREVVSDGPLQLRIRSTYRLGRASTLKQDMVFHADTEQVDFDTRVDWHEKYQFLKVAFGVEVLAETARHEIQFGHVARSTHDNTTVDRAQFDVCAHKWTDVSENGFGVAFLNDSKYACTIKDGEYRLSLIKSSRHPDPRGDEGEHRFAYAMLPHDGFSVVSVVRPAYEFNVPPILSAGESVRPSLVSVDAPNVIVEAVKWAEDAEAFVVRLYEAGKTGTHARVTFGHPVREVVETNLLEEEPVPVNGGRLYFRPFEIKTLLVTPA